MPYDHVQAEPADPWVIEHKLGCHPVVVVYTYSSTGQITNASVMGEAGPGPNAPGAGLRYITADICTIHFGTPTAGRARLV